jgi:hypothetical protein
MLRISSLKRRLANSSRICQKDQLSAALETEEHSPPCLPSPMSPPQNPPHAQPLQHHSPLRPSTKSPPQNPPPPPQLPSPHHHSPPPQNPLKAQKKQDANVDEPRTDILSVVGKFFGNLHKYQHKDLL